LGADHRDLAVDRAEADPDSMLNLTRKLVAFRNANEAMLVGSLNIIEAQSNLLIFERISDNQHLICAFNMGNDTIAWQPAQPDRWRVVKSVNDARPGSLPPYGAQILEKIA
jgi:alpha-glucosidase